MAVPAATPELQAARIAGSSRLHDAFVADLLGNIPPMWSTPIVC
jgi:hypothetical protein